jgi:hypothetical protein
MAWCLVKHRDNFTKTVNTLLAICSLWSLRKGKKMEEGNKENERNAKVKKEMKEELK